MNDNHRRDDATVPRTEFPVTGLAEPVELRLDEWGVPHIYATSTDDVFRAQGFNIARDRLFQIDLWRRRGLGLLSEAFGQDYVEHDRAARLFLYRGDLRAEWDSYGPEAERIAASFTSGINAYLDWLDAHPEALPPEFTKLGHAPARWEPADLVRIRTNVLSRNLASEALSTWITCAADIDATELALRLQPPWEPVIPEGFDPCSLPEDVLTVYSLATADVTFDKKGEPSTAKSARFDGSNNWVISGARTESGRPILANDPHRAYSTPSLRYLAHLSAPGLDVIGGGEPALPGISMGHNGTVGFGMTIFAMDQEDLYCYDLDPQDHSRYRYGTGWESLHQATERVPVAGQDPVPVDMSFTRHGPVIKVDEANHRAYAVRALWLDPGMAPYFAGLRLLRTTNFEEFRENLRHWGAPTENHVYADVDGNIGWVPAGRAPKRLGYDGLSPVPGDGRYEWDGHYDSSDLPHSYNPEQGFFASANEMNLPPDFPYREKRIGFEWSAPYRHQRITEVLAADGAGSIGGSAALQNDQLSVPARHILAVLRTLRPTEERSRAALDLLRNWDAVESADSAAAALFTVWRTRHLEPAFVRMAAPKAAELIAQPDMVVLLEALERPELWFGQDATAHRDSLLLDTLAEAHDDVTQLLGPDAARWRWGDLLHSEFDHAMTGVLDEADVHQYNVGPLRRGGSEHTVNASGLDPKSFRHISGPSVRIVLDVGDWDASVAMNTPGQSGNQDSPHYRDLAEPWAEGRYFPLYYSREAVVAHTARIITLIPR